MEVAELQESVLSEISCSFMDFVGLPSKRIGRISNNGGLYVIRRLIKSPFKCVYTLPSKPNMLITAKVPGGNETVGKQKPK